MRKLSSPPKLGIPQIYMIIHDPMHHKPVTDPLEKTPNTTFEEVLELFERHNRVIKPLYKILKTFPVMLSTRFHFKITLMHAEALRARTEELTQRCKVPKTLAKEKIFLSQLHTAIACLEMQLQEKGEEGKK